jgi:hypothetical protein
MTRIEARRLWMMQAALALALISRSKIGWDAP